MAANSTVLVSFIGKGRSPKPGEPHRYEYATYAFPSRAGGGATIDYATSLFGTVLLRYLRDHLGVNVTRWLVMGTSASQWSELLLALDDPLAHEDLFQMSEDIANLSKADSVKPPDLAAWAAALNRQSPVEIRTALVDKGLTAESHMEICRILFEQIPRGSDVVFDITHGFRHQPVIASFAVGLMRRTHSAGTVRFFYGAMEGAESERAPKPVVELPICEQLLDTTEGAAVLKSVGNYERLATCLGVDAAQLWFYDSTNQLDNRRGELSAFLHRLDERSSNPVAAEAVKLVREELAHWGSDADLVARLCARAEHAKSSHDYLQAALLTFEGIITRAVNRRSFPAASGRDERELAKDWLMDNLPREPRAVFNELRIVRNACAHGRAAAAMPPALREPQSFNRLINEAISLLRELERYVPLEAPQK